MSSTSPRVPDFLARGLSTAFSGNMRGVPSAFTASAASRPGAPPPSAPEPRAEVQAEPSAGEVRAQTAALERDRVRMTAEFGERVASALEVLRSAADRLAADVRVEAIELGLLVARRILETELSSSVEPLVALVRGAVRRLGEGRRIVVRLAPADAEAVTAAAAASGARPLAGIAVAEIEVLADASLGRGDCVVEGEFGSVDGRLSARLEEVRRALLATVLDSETELDS
jgi:flagellar biosynthesis/type III secretory pathway protein FliH